MIADVFQAIQETVNMLARVIYSFSYLRESGDESRPVYSSIISTWLVYYKSFRPLSIYGKFVEDNSLNFQVLEISSKVLGTYLK